MLSAAQCQASPAPTVTPAPTALPRPALDFAPIAPGDGTDLMDRLLEAGVIRVGVWVWPDPNFSPPAFRGFSNAKTGGALNGFEVDLARHLADAMGLELELVEAWPPVIYSGDWRGQWDIAIASLTPFDPPPATTLSPLYYSTPYAYLPVGFLLPAASSAQTLNDLSGKRVGVLEHSAWQYFLAGQPLPTAGQNLPPLTAVPLSNLAGGIRQLAQPVGSSSGEIEALFGPLPVFREAIKSDLPVKLLPQPETVGVQPLAIAAVAPDGLAVTRLMAEINRILAQYQRQGALAEIYIRWYGQDYSRADAQLQAPP